MKKLILSLLFLFIYSHGMADEIVTLKNGDKAILLDSGRWSIMAPRKNKGSETDKEIKPISSKPKKNAETYMEIKLIDLKQDINAFAGKKIKTEAFAVAYEFMLQLKEDKSDTSSLSSNINKLSHEKQNTLREECIDGCNVTVYGRIGNVIQGDKGIIADKIEW